MKTFFGEPKLKEAVRHRVAEHERLDRIIQGHYWAPGWGSRGTGYKGCFIGCSLEMDELRARILLDMGLHDAFEVLLGLPAWFAYLGEDIFEHLSQEDARKFPLRLYDAIPVGVDLEQLRKKLLIRYAEATGMEDLVKWVREGELPEAFRKAISNDFVAAPLSLHWRFVRDLEDAGNQRFFEDFVHAWECVVKMSATEQAEMLIRMLRELEPTPDEKIVAELPETPAFTEYYAKVRAEAE